MIYPTTDYHISVQIKWTRIEWSLQT